MALTGSSETANLVYSNNKKLAVSPKRLSLCWRWVFSFFPKAHLEKTEPYESLKIMHENVEKEGKKSNSSDHSVSVLHRGLLTIHYRKFM